MITAEQLWEAKLDRRYIAGPWVPQKYAMYRFNWIGEPIAMAENQDEIISEDIRLEKLGYELTDKNRIAPISFWRKINEIK